MEEVRIKYTFQKRTKVFDLKIPSSWEELSISNILYIGKYWQSWQLMISNNLNLTKAKALLFMELTGIKSQIRKKEIMFALANIDPKSGVNVLQFTDFIFNKFDLVKNLIPEINAGSGVVLYGPSDRLSDISIDEFTFAFSCYTQFGKTNEEKFLNKLAAVLYRPQNPEFSINGERREAFNNKLIAKREGLFQTIDDSYKNAIYLFFKGCMEFLSDKYKAVFNSDDGKGTAGSFNDVVLGISGGKFGTFDQTKQENLHVVLTELNRMILENKKK